VAEIEQQAPNGIHILFNNAGVAGEGSREGYEPTEDAEKFKEQLWKSSEEEWARILNVNVIGYYVSGHTTSPPTAASFQPLLTDS
jgi:NAD(P)-dependent dehydrogenase (short-subunit alcohol dehydrogenase family)